MTYLGKYKDLRTLLEKKELGWICQQVDEEIENGKTEIVKQQGKKELLKRTEYDDREKYILLLEAFKKAIADQIIIKDEIKYNHMNDISKIQFIGEYDNENTIEINKDEDYLNSNVKIYIENINRELDNVRNN